MSNEDSEPASPTTHEPVDDPKVEPPVDRPPAASVPGEAGFDQWPPEAEAAWRGDEQRRFSFFDLLVVVTAGAIGGGGVAWFPPGLFAFVAGVVALVCLILFNTLASLHRWIRTLFAAVLMLYLVAIAVTLVQAWN